MIIERFFISQIRGAAYSVKRGGGKMEELYGMCVAEIGSMTQAMRAQKLLSELAIPSTVQKAQSSSGRGCAYGLYISCAQKENAEMIFSREGVKIRSWKNAK